MIVLFRGSDSTVELYLVDSDNFQVIAEKRWEAGRQMSRGLLKFLRDTLAEHDLAFHDVTAVGAYSGPGSYTSLRIGLTVMNTLALDLKIPIVGVSLDDNWRETCLELLKSGQNHQVVMPHYGAEVQITAPKH